MNSPSEFIPLVKQDSLQPGQKTAIDYQGHKLLVINHNGTIHIVANECGHFGVPLEDGTISDNSIVCSQHGIGFDLITGQISNRPWENCEPIRVFPVMLKDGHIGTHLSVDSPLKD